MKYFYCKNSVIQINAHESLDGHLKSNDFASFYRPTYLNLSKSTVILFLKVYSSVNRNTENPGKIVFKVFMNSKEAIL